MRYYTNVQMIGNEFLVRGYEDGKSFKTREQYRPTLFVPSKKRTKYKTLDGTCEYPEIYYDCSSECLLDSDGDEVCDEAEVTGCTDDTACNYSAEATDDDGTCEYAVEYYDCDDVCLNDSDGDGICNELEIPGCTNSVACNYDSLATDDDGTCEYADFGYDCEGECVDDLDGDGICRKYINNDYDNNKC